MPLSESEYQKIVNIFDLYLGQEPMNELVDTIEEIIAKRDEIIDDLNGDIVSCRVLDYQERLAKIEAVVDTMDAETKRVYGDIFYRLARLDSPSKK